MQMSDTLLLTLSSNARVVNSQHYGPLLLKCRSYLDRLELILTPAPDAGFKKNIPVIPRGLTRGLFPGSHHDYRSMYIKARRQDDGTYLAVVPRDEELGRFSYYYENRTRASERADEETDTDSRSYEE